MNETILLLLLLLLSVEAVLLLAYRQNWADKVRRYKMHFEKEQVMITEKSKGLQASIDSLRSEIAALNNEALFPGEE